MFTNVAKIGTLFLIFVEKDTIYKGCDCCVPWRYQPFLVASGYRIARYFFLTVVLFKKLLMISFEKKEEDNSWY